MKKLSEIITAVKDYPVKRVAVAAAADLTVLEAVKAATEASVATAVLVGDEKVIRAYAEQTDLTLTKDDVVSEPVPEKAALCAAQLVSTGRADVLMKGHIHTDDFLRAVLDKEVGLRTGYRMSHVFACEMPAFDRLIMVTDSAMNIAPDLEAKAEIILNADYFCEVIGISSPRVACLAAVELLNPQMPAQPVQSKMYRGRTVRLGQRPIPSRRKAQRNRWSRGWPSRRIAGPRYRGRQHPCQVLRICGSGQSSRRGDRCQGPGRTHFAGRLRREQVLLNRYRCPDQRCPAVPAT
jgi:hypothetical protein